MSTTLGTIPLGKLHAVLDKAFPRFRNSAGGLGVRRLAKEMGLTRQAVYLWFENEAIPAKSAKKLVALSNGKLTLEKLSDFIFTKAE